MNSPHPLQLVGSVLFFGLPWSCPSQPFPVLTGPLLPTFLSSTLYFLAFSVSGVTSLISLFIFKYVCVCVTNVTQRNRAGKRRREIAQTSQCIFWCHQLCVTLGKSLFTLRFSQMSNEDDSYHLTGLLRGTGHMVGS